LLKLVPLEWQGKRRPSTFTTGSWTGTRRVLLADMFVKIASLYTYVHCICFSFLWKQHIHCIGTFKCKPFLYTTLFPYVNWFCTLKSKFEFSWNLMKGNYQNMSIILHHTFLLCIFFIKKLLLSYSRRWIIKTIMKCFREIT